MNTLCLLMQVVIALGIVNVWIVRFGQVTAWRGGDAINMREEFAVYGFPYWFMLLIGAAKLLLALLLILGVWFPEFTLPAAGGMTLLMAGAVSMHVRVGDPPIKSLPAMIMLLLSSGVVLIRFFS